MEPSLPPYRSLEHWRGLAACWVVMIHSCLPLIATVYPNLRYQPLFVFSLWGELGVPIFFVVSGYCIVNAAYNAHRKPNAMKSYVWARCRRIYPPYWAATACALTLSLLVIWAVQKGIIPDSNLAHQNIWNRSPLYYFAMLTLTQTPLQQTPFALYIFWTLCYEVAFYAVVGVVLWGALRRNTGTLLYVLHGLTVGSLLWRIVSPHTLVFPFGMWPQFGLGILVFHIVLRPKDRFPTGILTAVLLLIAAFFVMDTTPNRLGHTAERIHLVFCAGFALLLLFLHKVDDVLARSKWIKPLAVIGTFSYSLYLTHMMSIGLLSQVAKKLGMTEATFPYVFFLMILVSLIVGYLFFLIAERPFIPARKAKIEKEMQTLA